MSPQTGCYILRMCSFSDVPGCGESLTVADVTYCSEQKRRRWLNVSSLATTYSWLETRRKNIIDVEDVVNTLYTLSSRSRMLTHCTFILLQCWSQLLVLSCLKVKVNKNAIQWLDSCKIGGCYIQASKSWLPWPNLWSLKNLYCPFSSRVMSIERYGSPLLNILSVQMDWMWSPTCNEFIMHTCRYHIPSSPIPWHTDCP